MNLEEDAMLTAIGQMSMEQAREKWGERWSEFCQSLSRWKSIHQLLRLGRLNSVQQRLASTITDSEARRATIQALRKDAQIYADEMNAEAETLYSISMAKSSAEESYKLAGKEKYPAVFGDPYREKAPKSRSGKKFYQDHIQYAIQAANFTQIYQSLGGDEALYQSEWEYQKYQSASKIAKSLGEENQAYLDELNRRKARVQDEYDITKPYAMGLLVADIFYSLAEAIQGEIYL